MAQGERAGPLQLLGGTGEPGQPRRIPGSSACALGAFTSPPKPEAPDLLGAYSRLGCALASSTASNPSLSCGSLCRQSSAIRTGCAKERPSGSVRGAISNDRPYRDPTTPVTRLAAQQQAAVPDR